MKVGVFSCTDYTKRFFKQYGHNCGFDLEYIEARLTAETAVLAAPYDAVCIFVNDNANADVIKALKRYDVGHIALRCAGFNNVDINYARQRGISVSRVPAYSPEAVGEYTIALMLTLNRKLHKAYNRVREHNFRLHGLLGFNMIGKTVGVIGTGKIGQVVVRILRGFQCNVICVDPFPNKEVISLGAEYVDMDTLLHNSDIITLHCPLNEQNQHMIHHDSINKMKDGVMLINTSRGALIHTQAVVAGLKSGKIGYLGLDVYEKESELFFADHSCEVIEDDVFMRLASFHNSIVTGHQGFFTEEAVEHITTTTLENLQYYVTGKVNKETFL